MGASVGTFGAAEAAIAEAAIAEAGQGAEGLGFDSAAFGTVKTLPPEIAGLDKLRLPDLYNTKVSDLTMLGLEKEVVLTSLENLMSFPFVKERVGGERLNMHGLWNDTGAGVVEHLDAALGKFVGI